jgi:hypothetical protein
MKKLTTGLLIAVLFAAAAALPGVLIGGGTALAQDDEQETSQESEASENEGVVYRYQAQPGDSYTLMARKAVQTYGLKHEVNLSLAQIIYAETNMAVEAGSPQLEIGQQVEVAESVIEQWVERAQELSDEVEAAWDYYAQFADFNTDFVGESR